MSRLPRAARSALAVALLALAAGVPASAQQQLQAFADLSRTFRGVYERVAPAVVLIRTEGETQMALPRFHPPLDDDDAQRPFTGLGSGVIVSADGYILSNHHVVRDADSIRVELPDRTRLTATVVGADSLIDIALLKVDAQDLPTAVLGRSQDLQVGDWVLAIGYPLGMGTTLTHGIVSALGRQAQVISADYRIESFIQTNAVINPGNSGGPLLDLQGRVVGINTAIFTKTGYFSGYGLAVPIDLAREAMDDLLHYGRIVRGYLGISMDEVDARLVQRRGLDLSPPRGVLVRRILNGSPAARSGLAEGDVILALDGHRVDLPNQVQTLIYARDPGDPVTLEVWRDGGPVDVRVVLGEREDDRRLARGQRRVEHLGLTVAALDDSTAARLGFTESIARQLGLESGPGVVVTVVDAAGPASARGIEVDDVITEVDRTVVATLDEFRRSVSELEPGSSGLFWLWRAATGVDVRTLPIPSRRD